MKGKPNWEHLSEELHVLVVVEDTQRRAEVKMQRAVDEIKRLLVPAVITTVLIVFDAYLMILLQACITGLPTK